MKMTVEISMYPFRDTYRAQIREFIDRLNTYEGFRIETSITSTTVVGDYDKVMAMLGEMFKWSHDTHGRSVFVTKFIPGYSPE